MVLLIGVIDREQRKIPNHLLAILLLVAALTAAASGLDLSTIAINAAIGLALTLPGYIKGIVGGGDVKLMLALSPLWPTVQLLLIFAIGVFATVLALRWTDAYQAQHAVLGQHRITDLPTNKAGLPLGTAMAAGMCLYAIGSAVIGAATFF